MLRLRPDVKKRILDVTLCITAIPILLPLFVAVAAMVRLSSPGPAFYSATRIGRNGAPFRVYKFRTMVTNDSGLRVTRSGDPRITTVGRWLRASKLDELPQIINVLRGEMSLVGPRPEDPKYVEAYNEEQRGVLSVAPGMTSLAFLHFGHEQKYIEQSGATDPEGYYVKELLPTKLAIELDYVRDHTIRRDFKILARTFAQLIS